MNEDILLFLEKLEEYLLKANLKIDIVKDIMNFLASKVINNKLLTKEEIIKLTGSHIKQMISNYIVDFDIEPAKKPYVMLVCGINGSGKTTTIGKMINLLNDYGWNLMIAGCDTYRAGAENQLKKWIQNQHDSFISVEKQTDTPSKIAVRAYNIAKEKNKDILLIDTSGRLQNNQDLMAELLKIKQKLKEISINIPNDVVLIIDSSCGYNAIEQAKMYNDLIGITGIIATKIDISKKPGIILSVCKSFDIKIFGVCSGEEKDQIDSLDPQEFVNAIFCDINSIL